MRIRRHCLCVFAACFLGGVLPATSLHANDLTGPVEEVDEMVKEDSTDEALALAKKLTQEHPKEGKAWYALGRAYLGQKKFDPAREAFTTSINLDPQFAKSWMGLLRCCFLTNNLTGGQSILEALLQKHPDSATGWTQLANLKLRRGFTPQVEEGLQKAESLKSTDPEVWGNIGVIYGKMDKLDKAIAALHEALRLKPDYAEAWNNLGYALSLQGKPDEAIAAYKKCVQANPKYVRGLTNMALVYQKQKKWQLARAAVTRVALEEPLMAAMLQKMFAETYKNSTGTGSDEN